MMTTLVMITRQARQEATPSAGCCICCCSFAIYIQ